ncbi:Hypothetical protein SCF082_LOCUS48818 [Durusdinium trenchii]|uniref:Polydeoxyribonucleotide synthase [ATP] n=1 Tax=Durusdinium trenchii TaxID=1381693 RepID=A0ABP0RVL2_9DINO
MRRARQTVQLLCRASASGRSERVWRLEIDGDEARREWGVLGGKLRSTTSKVPNETWIQRVVRDKLSNGYQVDGAVQGSELSRLVKQAMAGSASESRSSSLATPLGLGKEEQTEQRQDFASDTRQRSRQDRSLPELQDAFELELVKHGKKKPTKWKLSYDPETGAVTSSTNGQRATRKDAANGNDAAHLIAQETRKRLDAGYKVPASAQVPEWILEFQRKRNPLLEQVEACPDDQALEIHLERGNRLWSVFVSGEQVERRFGLAGLKMQVSKRVYAEGRGGRTPNQQARFEAMAQADKKIDHGYKLIGEQVDANEPSDRETCTDVPVPMLASTCDLTKLNKRFTEERVFVQPKLDGLRCLADLHTGELWSRGRKRFDTLSHIELDIVTGHRQAHGAPRWADGELYSSGLSIQKLNSIIRGKSSSTEDRQLIKLFLFDIVEPEPFKLRSERLSEWFAQVEGGISHVLLTETRQAFPSEVMQCHHDFVAQGYEGTIVRLPIEEPYAQGTRSRSLQKLKDFQQEEFPCTQVLPVKHQAEPIAGSFVLQVPNSDLTFQAPPQASLQDKREMWARRDEFASGSFLATVKFFNLTDDGLPRFPVVLGFRNVADM